jgi:hypothetical protein
MQMKTCSLNIVITERLKLLLVFATCILGWLAPEVVMAQSAIERHIWQDRRLFEPMSRTAHAITGSIKLSGNPRFATTGSKMSLTFANGRTVGLTQVAASWREWDFGRPKVTAEVFRMDRDPGKLEQGNMLCGTSSKDRARYIVFHDSAFIGQTRLLGIAVFRSNSAPKNIRSSGLCGTFNFYAE